MIVPRGVEHRPVADDEVQVLLFELASTLNTGDVRNERTVERPENASDPRGRNRDATRGAVLHLPVRRRAASSRSHLEGVEVGRRVSVYQINPGTGERVRSLAEAAVGDGGWVDLFEPIMVRAGDAFVAVPQTP